MNLDDRLRREIINKLSRHPVVREIILFGPRVHGSFDDLSNIDIAIAAPGVKLEEWLAIQEIVDGLITSAPIDLVLLEGAPDAVRRKIRIEGKVLYERE